MRRQKKHIYSNEGKWYIQVKDPKSKKWKARSTGLKATKENLAAAERILSRVESELKELIDLDYTEGSLKEAIDEFKAKNSGKSKSTTDSYDYCFGFLKKKFNLSNSCLVITKKTAEDFYQYLNQLDGYAQNTKFGVGKNFSKFLKFLFEYSYLPKPFVINSDVKIRMPKGDPKIFSDEDRSAILKNLTKKKKNTNFKLMIMMLMFTGLRPCDINGITVDQIDLKKMFIRYYSPKTERWFNRPLHPKLKTILLKRIKKVRTGRIFEYADVRNMGKAYRRYLKDIKLDTKEYNLTTFRKDFLSRCQEAGVPISAASLLAGHSRITTTMEYYTSLSPEFLRSELNKLN